ncbi:hypothetical protein [Microbacterium sp.]|uniref:hypothetical protein n=1 Tax=Microbacterium sp. TaxID=51671 RepID=UPI003A948839
MRALPVQNRSTMMWLLGGLGVLVWAALSMLLSGSPASASQTPATHVAASTPTLTKAAAGQGHPGQGHDGRQNANRGNGGANAGHQVNSKHKAPAASTSAPSRAVQPARNIAVKTAQAVSAPAATAVQPARNVAVKVAKAVPAAHKSGNGNIKADAQRIVVPQNVKAVKAAPQRFAEKAGAHIDHFVEHVDNSGHHKARIADSFRGDRGWHGQHQLRTHPQVQAHKATQAHKAHKTHRASFATSRTHSATATAAPQPPSATPQPAAEAQAPAQPAAPIPAQHHTNSHPLSTAAQSSGAGSIFALEASAAAMPPTPASLRAEQALHADDVPPAGPVDSTESFPD